MGVAWEAIGHQLCVTFFQQTLLKYYVRHNWINKYLKLTKKMYLGTCKLINLTSLICFNVLLLWSRSFFRGMAQFIHIQYSDYVRSQLTAGCIWKYGPAVSLKSPFLPLNRRILLYHWLLPQTLVHYLLGYSLSHFNLFHDEVRLKSLSEMSETSETVRVPAALYYF